MTCVVLNPRWLSSISGRRITCTSIIVRWRPPPKKSLNRLSISDPSRDRSKARKILKSGIVLGQENEIRSPRPSKQTSGRTGNEWTNTTARASKWIPLNFLLSRAETAAVRPLLSTPVIHEPLSMQSIGTRILSLT